jgi:hypothetical protein
MEESDEHVLLRALRRFVEDSDQSIPRIAELMGVSGTTLSMWIGCSTVAAAHDASRNDGQRGHPRFQYGSRGATAIGGSGRRKPVPRNGEKNVSRTSRQFLPAIAARSRFRTYGFPSCLLFSSTDIQPRFGMINVALNAAQNFIIDDILIA